MELVQEKWISPSCQINPEHRFRHAATNYKQKMIIFGGSNGINFLNDIWAFDTKIFK